MARTVALTCEKCLRKFGGDQTERRHRVIAGDHYRCLSNAELESRGFYLDRLGVWHRGVSPDQGVLTLSDTAQEHATPSGNGVTPTASRRLARTTDPSTSHRAAKSVAPRTGTQKALLLSIFREAPDGLTDEEAAARAGLTLYQATKRCADLRNDGLIEPVGERKGVSGTARRVCRVVEAVSA